MSQTKARSKLYSNINVAAASVTAATIATASMPTTTSSVPIKDESGNILGYVALYATAALT